MDIHDWFHYKINRLIYNLYLQMKEWLSISWETGSMKFTICDFEKIIKSWLSSIHKMSWSLRYIKY